MNNLFDNLANKKILILGFGREGQSTYRLLRGEYPEMLISIADINDFEIKNDKNVILITGKNYLDNLIDFDYIIKSPGVPFGKELIEAKKHGVKITSQTKIFFEKCNGKIIGITGTKGKSTTSTLIYKMLKNDSLKAFLVGNIENPSLDDLVENDSTDTFFVYELSSQQLADLDKSPPISVVLNIGVDHLDWHGNRENYVDAKRNIVRYQNTSDLAIINGDDQMAKEFAEITNAKVQYFGFKGDNYQGFLKNNKLTIKLANKEELIIDTEKIILRGKHNWLNVLASSIVAVNLGINNKVITDTIYSFKGLEHRLEFVDKIDEISFFNDSISTNPTAFSAAINSFTEPLTVIMGGYDRGLDYHDLAEEVISKPNIKNIILIGQTGNKLMNAFRDANYNGEIINLGNTSIIRMVEVAKEKTPKGGVVILSPAAASFDMFKNYKDRGNQFKEAVVSLKG